MNDGLGTEEPGEGVRQRPAQKFVADLVVCVVAGIRLREVVADPLALSPLDFSLQVLGREHFGVLTNFQAGSSAGGIDPPGDDVSEGVDPTGPRCRYLQCIAVGAPQDASVRDWLSA